MRKCLNNFTYDFINFNYEDITWLIYLKKNIKLVYYNILSTISIQNEYQQFLDLEKHSYFYNTWYHNFDKMFFFIGFTYKKNKYVPYIYNHHLTITDWDLQGNFYELSSKDIQIHLNFMIQIYNYFNWIDKFIFQLNGPTWLLNKNKTTLFTYTIAGSEEKIIISDKMPFEVLFFWIFVIIYIYLNLLYWRIWIFKSISFEYIFNLNLFIQNISLISDFYIDIWNKCKFINYPRNQLSTKGGSFLDNAPWKYTYTYKINYRDMYSKYKNIYFLYNFNPNLEWIRNSKIWFTDVYLEPNKWDDGPWKVNTHIYLILIVTLIFWIYFMITPLWATYVYEKWKRDNFAQKKFNTTINNFIFSNRNSLGLIRDNKNLKKINYKYKYYNSILLHYRFKFYIWNNYLLHKKNNY